MSRLHARRFRARPRFPGYAFGPMALRQLVRERFEPEEHLLGWAMVRVTLSPRVRALEALLSIVPFAGVVFGAELARGLLHVLSDRRLWAIERTTRPSLRPEPIAVELLRLEHASVLIEPPGHAKPIEHSGRRLVRVHLHCGRSRPLRLSFIAESAQASRRVAEAFRTLAWADGEPGGYAGGGDRRESSTDRRRQPL